MQKYMLLYVAPVSAEQQMNVSPEEMSKAMEPWMGWFEKLGDALVDAGTPLGHGLHATKSGSSEAHSEVSGYSIVQANDLAAAKAMIMDHPHLMMPNASIDV